MEAPLFGAVLEVCSNDQWIAEKNTFCFRLTNVMFIRTLAAIAFVPIEADNLLKANHCILSIYTDLGR